MTAVQESTQTKLRETCRDLLERGAVGYIIGWGATRFPDVTRPTFLFKPADAENLVWNEYCVNGLAKYALDDRKSEQKIGILVRGCDSRAVMRMVQDNQVRRESLCLIGIPCDGKQDKKCAGCTCKNPVEYDVLVGEPVEEKNADRFSAVEELEKLSADEKYDHWGDVFDRCIRCYACRNACPACNCVICYQDSDTTWQGKAQNRAQNQIYGVTRAYHVGDRCIECGECERACPMGLPVMALPRKMLKDICELTADDYACGLAAREGDDTSFLGRFDLDDKDDFG